MNKIALIMLLSCAPLTLHAGCCDDKALECQQACDQVNPDRGLVELVVFDALEAYNATTAYIIISGDMLSNNGWSLLVPMTTGIFGEPTAQSDRSLTYVFGRGGSFIEEWFLLLAGVEAKYLVLAQMVKETPATTEAIVEFGLNG